jgi:C4-dicarboxylate-specific signal transduction histidine kinase
VNRGRALFRLVPVLLLAAFAPPAAAESLYKCTGPTGEVSIQSEPCPKGSTQVWKREATPDPAPSPEELAARAALAEAEAQRAAELARQAEEERRAEEARRAAEAQRRADEAAGKPPGRTSDCTKAHDFNDAALAKDWLELSDYQKRRLRDWVIEACRDPDAPVADTTTP